MSDPGQVIRYVAVGGAITLADIWIYHLLTGKAVGLPRVPANLISTTIGMVLGFALHFVLVFHPVAARIPVRLVRYVLTTGCSVYGVQNLVIHFCAGRFRTIASIIPNRSGVIQTADVADRIFGKMLAAAAGMIWNFALFKLFVYG